MVHDRPQVAVDLLVLFLQGVLSLLQVLQDLPLLNHDLTHPLALLLLLGEQLLVFLADISDVVFQLDFFVIFLIKILLEKLDLVDPRLVLCYVASDGSGLSGDVIYLGLLLV